MPSSTWQPENATTEYGMKATLSGQRVTKLKRQSDRTQVVSNFIEQLCVSVNQARTHDMTGQVIEFNAVTFAWLKNPRASETMHQDDATRVR